MSTRAQIVGWSHIPFGKLAEPDTESLMSRVSLDALEHAGIGCAQVDAIFVGVINDSTREGYRSPQRHQSDRRDH